MEIASNVISNLEGRAPRRVRLAAVAVCALLAISPAFERATARLRIDTLHCSSVIISPHHHSWVIPWHLWRLIRTCKLNDQNAKARRAVQRTHVPSVYD